MDEHIAFSISASEADRLRKQINVTVYPRNFFPLIGLLVLANGFSTIRLMLSEKTSYLTVIEIVGMVAIVFGFALMIGVMRQRLPRAGVLTISALGVVGTLDEKPANIAWKSVASVRDIADAIVIQRRSIFPNLIAIPKDAVGNVESLWTIFEANLIAKRGLVRSATRGATIVNTAS